MGSPTVRATTNAFAKKFEDWNFACARILPRRPPHCQSLASARGQEVQDLSRPAGHVQATAGMEHEVQQQADSEHARARVRTKRKVNEGRRPGVQRMKTDAATQGIVDRVR